MKNTTIIIAAFGISVIAAVVAAAQISPPLMGVAEATPAGNWVGMISTIIAGLGGFTGIWKLIQSSTTGTVGVLLKDTLGDLSTGNVSAVTLDAAFVVIAATALQRGCDPAVLSDIQTLKIKMNTK